MSLKSNLEAAVSFMAELQKNNHKQWFDANRERYETVLRDPLKLLAKELAGPATLLLADFAGKPKISRINNDLRFHPNKPPYKQHMWVSFAAGSVADPFASVGRDGWTTGIMLGSWESEKLKYWRRNLVENFDVWKLYREAIQFEKSEQIWVGDSYKRPLFDDIPEEVSELVQVKQMVVHVKTRKRFPAEPVGWLADGLAAHMPVYLMATTPPVELVRRLSELGSTVPPLGERSGAVFSAMSEL